MAIAAPGGTIDGSPNGVDIESHPAASRLLKLFGQILEEVKNDTPGIVLQEKLNARFGCGHPSYVEICGMIRAGVAEGWVASGEITGPNYRRGKIALPCALTHYLSVTAVYFGSKEVLSGQYHKHPYGEFSCIVPIDETFELEGQEGVWHHSGWTSFAPGTHHYPRARGGRGVTVFFLPSGRISYDAKPSDPQPAIL